MFVEPRGRIVFLISTRIFKCLSSNDYVVRMGQFDYRECAINFELALKKYAAILFRKSNVYVFKMK